jgi:hypothetical protein
MSGAGTESNAGRRSTRASVRGIRDRIRARRVDGTFERAVDDLVDGADRVVERDPREPLFAGAEPAG